MGRQLKLGFTPLAHRRQSFTQVRTRHAVIRDAREIAFFWTVKEILRFWGRSVRREAPPACVRRTRKSTVAFSVTDAGAVGE